MTASKMRHELLFAERMVRCFADRPDSLWTMFEQCSHADPEAPALFWGENGSLSYAELRARALDAAGALVNAGIAPGDRLATWISNRPEYPVLFLACWRVGATLVPLDTRLSEAEGRFILEHSGARFLLGEEDLADRYPAPGALANLQHVVMAEDLAQWSAQTPVDLPDLPGDEEDLAAIIYTSGTTGRPKGVMLAHVNLLHSIRHFELAWGLPRGSKTLIAIPGCNVTGLVTEFLTFFSLGGSVVMIPPFKAATFIEEAARHKIDHAFMVPAQYKLCLMNEAFEKHDLSSWKLGSFGGAPMPLAFIRELQARLPSLKLSNGYGATETGSPAALLSPDLTERHPDAIGRPVPCADVLVIGEDGKEVPRGEAGELWIAGPMVARGYWQNPETTAEAFIGRYWKSGDIVSIDEDDIIRLHDRKKDVVNRGGYKIYSSEVEAVLMQHPDVAEAAVVGRPDEVLGETAHAFICLKPGASVPGDPRSLATDELADYKRPESWTIGHDPLPRNSNGKILKNELRDLLPEQA